MNADAESRVLASEFHRLLECRTGNHQTGACEYAFFVSPNDRFVDLLRHAEVVRVHNYSVLAFSVRGGFIDVIVGQELASAASDRSRGSARLLVGRNLLTTHRLACAWTNSLRFARSWRNSFASL